MGRSIAVAYRAVVRDLRVIGRGADYVVIDKPAGLPSAPMRGAESDPSRADSVVARVRSMFPEADGPITVHRLDMETSGLLVVGLTRDAHRTLSRQFMHRKVGKTYAAVLSGRVQGDEGSIDLPLIVDWPRRPRQKVDFGEGKVARTLYRVKGREHAGGRPVTRVEFRPMTGRSHQLRVHASTPRCLLAGSGLADEPPPGPYRCAWPARGGLGCPVLGDSLYGDVRAAERLLLHADSLAFWEPGSGAWVKFESPAPF